MINKITGVYIVHFDHPSPTFEMFFFFPANKIATGGARGIIFNFITQKYAFFSRDEDPRFFSLDTDPTLII